MGASWANTVNVTDNDSNIVRPSTANVDETKYRFICPQYTNALVPYLQYRRINNEIVQRKRGDISYRKVL
jgi:hypothetical protein